MRTAAALAVVAIVALSSLGAAHATSMTIHLLTNPTSPRGEQHCEQLTVPGGKGSPFWADEGWRYTVWVQGTCPSYFNFVNARTPNLDGFAGVTYVKLGVQTSSTATDFTDTPANTSVDMVMHWVTGYHGKHCDEMEVVGGKASPFWKAQGWRYATWRTGACPAAFNVNNEVTHGFMGFRVTYIIKGIHTTKTHAAARAHDVAAAPADMVMHWVTGYHGQHCDEMEVVGGKASPFWKAQGWRYATWRTGACPAAFNVNNKVESMFMGYPVTYIIKGIHTTKTHAPDAAGSSLSMLSLVPATRLRGAASTRS